MRFDEVWARAQVPGHLEIADGEWLWELSHQAFEKYPDLPMLEIGSFQGKSSMVIGAAGAELWMIEPSWLWNGASTDGLRESGFRYVERREDLGSRKALLENVRGLRTHLIAMASYEVPVDYLPQLFSFMFIDGDHTEGGIDVDCERFLPLLVSGGIVAFHDYDCPDYPVVKRAVDEATRGWEVLGRKGSALGVRKP